MTEAILQTELLAFLREKRLVGNFVCELKIVKYPKQKNFRMGQIQEHQWATLTTSEGKPFAYKISDSLGFAGVGRFTAKKPLDFIYIGEPKVYVGIGFWETRKTKVVYFLIPEMLKLAKDMNAHLSEEVIKEYCDWSIDLKRHKLYNYKHNGQSE
jgi:hypothetical protein